MSYIIECVDGFFKKIDIAEENLAGFSQKIDRRRDEIRKVLENIPNMLRKYNQSITTNNKSAVDKAVESVIAASSDSIQQWNNALQINLQGTEFMQKHEKYLVIMVFGAVKSGKSSLGNFFAGKYFSTANIDTEYKNRPKPEFDSEASGRKTGGISRELNGDAWFTEGVTDTTGAIQYFTLSGLRWMDSPGTGAVSLEGDTLDMEDLVNKHIPYVDLCIFLMNSSEPGLQEDMRYMEKLSREGQESLVVITRSDVVEEDLDENDEIIQVLQPKSPERRKLQEDDIVKRLSDQYPDLDTEKFRAISISTLLAKGAVEENNDEKFKASNLDQLMNILAEKASQETLALKMERPKKNLNSFIDELILGDTIDNKFDGLKALLNKFNALQEPINEYKNKIDSRKRRVTNAILSEVQNNLKLKLFEFNKYVEENNKTIDSGKINKEINSIIEKGIHDGLHREITSIIEGYSNTSLKTLSSLVSLGDLGKSYDHVEHTYKEYELVERKPDGWWESARSFFGKTYYRKKAVTKTEVIKIDIGTNVNDLLETLQKQSESIISNEVHQALMDIQTNYFAPQESYIKDMLLVINQTIDELQALKYKE